MLFACLEKYDVKSDRIHTILRDAANSMNRATELLQEDSFDCFVHKLYLVVGDGLKTVVGLSALVEKIKRLIRRLRKSHIEKEAFAKLQQEMEMELLVNKYLKEPRIRQDADPYEYWRQKDDGEWSPMKQLVQRFHSAPAGSVESERLFSTAGFIVNDLRKKLLVENLEKLLFCHHNLPIYDFKYSD